MLWSRVKRTIERHGLLAKGDRIIVGVSGGVDSMVLLHLLNACRKAFGLSLIVAHVNHGLRPEESEKEADLVRKETDRLGLPFEYGKFDAKGFSQARGLSLQDGGRRIRFRFFRTLLLKYEAQKIALGHHADDQVETILLGLLRGSGLKGLKGMLPLREGKVIRPLLEVWRGEIESFARENEIPYLTDSSNLKKDYFRNRIRLDFIPLIEREYQSNFKERMLRTSANLREENDYLEKAAAEAYQQIIHEEEGVFSFPFSEYHSLHKAIRRRILQRLLNRIYREKGVIEEVESLPVERVSEKLSGPSSSSFLLELPRGFFLGRRYGQIFIQRGPIESVPPFEENLIVPGDTFIREIGKKVFTREMEKDIGVREFKGPPNIAHLDLANLQWPLKIRNFRPGDRFWPMGAKGTQKLKEFFIDHKIPRFERPGIPLIVSGEKIVWIVGHRIDERVKVTEKTKRILRIEVL